MIDRNILSATVTARPLSRRERFVTFRAITMDDSLPTNRSPSVRTTGMPRANPRKALPNT